MVSLSQEANLDGREKTFTYVYPSTQAERIFVLGHLGSTIQIQEAQILLCQAEMKVEETSGARD